MPHAYLRFSAILISFMLVLLAACQTTEKQQQSDQRPAGQSEESTEYDPEYEKELERIFSLAREKEWSHAKKLATKLHSQAPDNPRVTRVYNWIRQEAEKRRAKAVEDEIRDISSQGSVFNPTVKSLLTESKNRGLPPKRKLREAIGEIEDTPYVPESYGKTVQREDPVYSLDEAPDHMDQVLDKKITIHLDNTPLERIIFDIGNAEGINFVADRSIEAFQQKLSVNMESVPLREFLEYVSRNLGIRFQIGKELIWIVAGDDESATLQKVRFYQLTHGLIRQAGFGQESKKVTTTTQKNKNTVTRVEETEYDMFVQDGASQNPYITRALDEFFDGDYLLDYERNLIMAKGTHEQLEVLERIIDHFDRPVQQVLIEARFVTVSKPAFLELGAIWETGRGLLPAQRSPQDFTGLGSDIGVTSSLGLQETFTNVLGRANLSATLKALEQSGESRTLSAPRITLVNNLPARISDGKIQYYYEEYTVQQEVTDRGATSSLVPQGKPQKITSGASLDVLASIGGDGKTIMLALHPEVNSDVELVNFATVTDFNSAGEVISTFDIKLPESRTQSLETRVKIKSGQTVVLGGVLERNQTTFVESVPILGNIPIIGPAFRKRTEVDKPRYLLIFVTASIVSPSGEFVLYDNKGSADYDSGTTSYGRRPSEGARSPPKSGSRPTTPKSNRNKAPSEESGGGSNSNQSSEN